MEEEVNEMSEDKKSQKKQTTMPIETESLHHLEDLKYALDASAIVAITNRKGIIEYVNDLFCEVCQYSRDELIGNTHQIIQSNHHPNKFFKEMWTLISEGKTWHGEICNRRKDGQLYWVSATVVPFVNELGEPYKYISIRHDITKEKQLEADMRKREDVYRLITDHSSDYIVIINHNGVATFCSPSIINLLGRMPEANTENFYSWLHEDDIVLLENTCSKMLALQESATNLDMRIRDASDQYITVEAMINYVLPNKDNVKGQFIIIMRNIMKRKQTEERVHYLAFHDSLTNLPNRRFFKKEIHGLVNSDSAESSFAAMIIDFDRFKDINDIWGRHIGNLTLCEGAKRIVEAVHPNGTVFRLISDEFVVLLKDIDGEETVRMMADSIVQAFHKPFSVAGELFQVTCSIGIVLFPQDGHDLEQLFQRADTALSAVKSEGGNDYTFFRPEMEERSIEQLLLENKLRTAIELEEFTLHYQAHLNLQTKTVIGTEALIRWPHTELGTIQPNKFIPLAEKNGLIIPLGEWVLRTACKQAKQWQNEGLHPTTISVNVSVKQLDDIDFVTKVKNILAETKLDAKWLELEVTETIFANRFDAAQTLNKLRELGIRIALDDFGTGYNSFSYVKALPIDTIKIDQSFVQDMEDNAESQAIIVAILSLGHSLGLDVIAEGIETEYHLNSLREEGCNIGQGFYISKPVAADEFTSLLKEGIDLPN